MQQKSLVGSACCAFGRMSLACCNQNKTESVCMVMEIITMMFACLGFQLYLGISLAIGIAGVNKHWNGSIIKLVLYTMLTISPFTMIVVFVQGKQKDQTEITKRIEPSYIRLLWIGESEGRKVCDVIKEKGEKAGLQYLKDLDIKYECMGVHRLPPELTYKIYESNQYIMTYDKYGTVILYKINL